MKQVQERELEPNEILDQAIKEGLSDFYVAYSGGKDSGIALDLTAKEFPQYFKGVVFVNTGIATKETVNFVESYCKQRNYPLYHLHAKDVKRKKDSKHGKINEQFDYENLVLNYGFPKEGLHTVTMRWLKLFSIRKFIFERIAMGEKPAIISGIRKNESARRKTKAKKYIYNDGKMWFISPLYFKSNEWVYDYFIKEDIKRSPVYETLHISGDCLCGCFAKKDELKLLEMFHPDVFTELKRLEKLIKEKGTDEAKKYSTWGNSGNTKDIESQTTIESFVCTDCILDRATTDDDTKKFNDELENIEAKLESLNA